MPVEHVEVDEVGEHDRAIARFCQGLERRIEQSRIAAGFHLLRNTLVRKNVRDLADTDDVAAGRDELVQHGRRVRRRRQVAPVAGTDVVLGTVADERPRDDTADVVLVDQLAGNVAEIVEPL